MWLGIVALIAYVVLGYNFLDRIKAPEYLYTLHTLVWIVVVAVIILI